MKMVFRPLSLALLCTFAGLAGGVGAALVMQYVSYKREVRHGD